MSYPRTEEARDGLRCLSSQGAPQLISSVNLRMLTLSSSLGALAGLLMFIQVPLFLPFLKLDLSDGLMLYLSLTLSPYWLAFAVLVKLFTFSLVKGDEYLWLGALMNFIATLTLVLPAQAFWRAFGLGIKRAITGGLIGTIVSSVVMSLINYLVLRLLFKTGDVLSLLIYGVLPFNLIRGVLATVTFIAICKLMGLMKYRTVTS